MSLIPILLAIIFHSAAVIGWHWTVHTKARVALEKWAQLNKFQIIKSKWIWFLKGVYILEKGSVVYGVTVRDAKGSIRTGRVYCGNEIQFVGILSPADVVVEWNEARTGNRPSVATPPGSLPGGGLWDRELDG